MLETWKSIVGYENSYEVSNTGRIKSLDRYLSTKNGKRLLKGKILNLKPDSYGYYIIGLWKEQKMTRKKVHRLVAQAFIPNPENKPQVNHIDGNKLNNNHNNLEWNTSKENIQHSLLNNLSSGINAAKLTTEQVSIIKKLLFIGKTHKSIAEQFNVSRSAITDIKIQKTWKNINLK